MELKNAKTIRFRKLYKPEQEAKYILEVQEDDKSSKWRFLGSFTERPRAEGYLEGYKKGLQHFDKGESQTSVPTFEDNWPTT